MRFSPAKPKFAQPNPTSLQPNNYRLQPLAASIVVLLALLVGSTWFSSSASSADEPKRKGNVMDSYDLRGRAAKVDLRAGVAEFGDLSELSMAGSAWLPLLPQSGPTVATYAGDCTTPKTVFNVRDADKTVCAQVQNAVPGWRVIWSNANFTAAQNNVLTSVNQNGTFTLNTGSNLGDWRVILFEPFGGTVRAVTAFTVIDAENPIVDLLIDTGATANAVAAGAQAVFTVQLSNNGPSSATNVQVTDAVPANTTFVSFAQLSGPVFTCNSPVVGNAGTTTCSIASLAKGDKATFLATYLVDGGVAAGSEISNTANISSGTVERPVPPESPDNNTSTGSMKVASAPCVITTSENITVDAAAGQAGAVVTYDAPTSTGNCGQAPEGSTSPISCNPASGSFFSLGVTTVLCAGQSGGAATFQVTVNSPGGGLTISLNGASPLTQECGNPFTDPGATAFDGNNQPVEVTITGPTIDRDTDTGTYVLTYSATDGTNSASTTRTVNVVDTTAPAITIEGANPFRIQQGSCSPFVDPGATANDDCAGTAPVTSSISGPGGLTSVDPNTAGTYTITYTATDGTRQATATRNVLVGQFSQDEVDQPSSANGPPTITLHGGDEITIECGAGFTDPGATAAVCQTSVSVTTSGTVDHQAPGTYSITYSATANGLTTTATRIVHVEDTTAPVITLNGANPLTVECHTSFTDPGATANDSCQGDFAATALGGVDADTVGTYTITYNASDASGHAATPVTRTVNVVDTTAPVVTAPANVTVNTGAGATSCGTTVSDAALGTATAEDSCAGSLSVTRTGVPVGNVFPVGTTTITYTVTDGFNTAEATQTVTVIDDTPPTITAPADVTVHTGPGATSCDTVVSSLGTPTTDDNCNGETISRSPSGNTFPVGTTDVIWTVTDAAGNTATATQHVTVIDNTPPVVTPPANITVFLPLNSTATSMAVNYPNPATATDNCPGTLNILYSPASGSTFPVGPTTVTASTTDAHGNSGSATFTVTVLYNFAGFFSPVGNPPTLNVVNAGRAVPVKFSLSGNKGLNIFAADSPYTVGYDCGTGVETNVEETLTAGSSTLTYNADSDQYHYVWKTEGSWAGTCRQLVVKLNDGSLLHVANFKFR